VSVTGRALRRGEADQVFRVITGLMGIRTDTVHPRIHGLRHYADAWVMCPAVKFPLVEVVEPVLRSA